MSADEASSAEMFHDDQLKDDHGVSGGHSVQSSADAKTYAAAAIRLLDADVPRDQLIESASHYAQARDGKAGSDKDSLLIFRLGSEWLGLPTSAFLEVTTSRSIHSLPHRRSTTIVGLVNVRGALLVCASLARLLSIEEVWGATGSESRSNSQLLLVIKGEGGRLAIPVDEVLGVERYLPSALKEVPATVAKATATYTKAVLDWDDKTIGVLDEQLLFYTINRSMA